MSHSGRRFLVAMAVSVVATTPACSALSGDDEASEPPPEVEFTPPPEDADDSRPPEVVALPLTALLTRSEELDRARHIALEDATADCMESRGFHYPVAPYFPPPDAYLIERPYGPWTFQEIAESGYEGPQEDVPDPVGDYLETLTAEQASTWDEALNGGQTRTTDHIEIELVDGTMVNVGLREETRSGCIYQSVSAVFGDMAMYEAYRQTLQNWHHDAYARTESSAVVQQGLSAWRGCMDDAGFGEFDGPVEVVEAFASAPGVGDDERSAGQADVGCKESANLHDAWFATKQQEEQEILDEHPDVVAEWQRILDEIRLRVQ